MGAHLIDNEFQSDKYPTCPRGKVPLSTKDPTAQDLLWEYAQRRREVDAEFSDDVETALKLKGFNPPREELFDKFNQPLVETVLDVSTADDIDARIYCADAAPVLAREVLRLRRMLRRE